MYPTIANAEAFRQVAERGSISAAAAAMGYTASAISQRVSALERETGVALLERLGNRIKLTEAGHRYNETLPAVFAALEVAAASISDPHTTISRVGLGGFPSGVSLVVPPALQILVAAGHPVVVDVTVMEDKDGLRELRLGEIDLLLVQEYSLVPLIRLDGFDYEKIASEPLVLMTKAETSSSELSHFADQRWLIPTEETACGYAIRQLCRLAGFEPQLGAFVDDFYTLALLAQAGAGVTVMPESAAIAFSTNPSELIPIAGCERNIYLLNRKNTTVTGAITWVTEALREAAHRR